MSSGPSTTASSRRTEHCSGISGGFASSGFLFTSGSRWRCAAGKSSHMGGGRGRQRETSRSRSEERRVGKECSARWEQHGGAKERVAVGRSVHVTHGKHDS